MLHEDWLRATAGLNIQVEMIETWYGRLWDLHTEPSRHYHTAVHLEEMLHYLAMLTDEGYLSFMGDEQTILLSIFFHDAIYDPKSACNEEDSAQLFETFANQAGFATTHAALVEDVSRYILATKKHVLSADNPLSLALFLDLDMAVLGKQQSAYQTYATLIRREYGFVDRNVYCTKRAKVLEAFLAQGLIYGTHVLGTAFETQARQNLQSEVAALKRGVIYGENE
ncbi:hypothetical protein MPSEU_000962700 [Mayamaea pseudoterrestris]|nr:hypothetical protein MPSEU_000962700 [Mayamaea pseudoterrestris]